MFIDMGKVLKLNNKNIYIIKEDLFDDYKGTYFLVELPQGAFTSIKFIIKGNTDFQALLDIAVDTAMELNLSFQYCDLYDAADYGMIDENGNVIDAIIAGNSCVCIPIETNIKELVTGNFCDFLNYAIKNLIKL